MVQLSRINNTRTQETSLGRRQTRTNSQTSSFFNQMNAAMASPSAAGNTRNTTGSASVSRQAVRQENDTTADPPINQRNVDTGQVRTQATRTSSSSANLFTVSASDTTSSSTTAKPAATDTTDSTTYTPEAAIKAFQSALLAKGVDPSAYNLRYTEQMVSFGIGSYTNKQITADLGNSKTESFMPELVFKNPQVAAMDLLRALNASRAS